MDEDSQHRQISSQSGGSKPSSPKDLDQPHTSTNAHVASETSIADLKDEVPFTVGKKTGNTRRCYIGLLIAILIAMVVAIAVVIGYSVS